MRGGVGVWCRCGVWCVGVWVKVGVEVGVEVGECWGVIE